QETNKIPGNRRTSLTASQDYTRRVWRSAQSPACRSHRSHQRPMEANGSRPHLPRRSLMSNILCCRNFPNVDEEDQPRDSLSRLGRGVGRSAASCIRESQLPPHPIFVITDAATDVTGLLAGIEVVRRDCHL